MREVDLKHWPLPTTEIVSLEIKEDNSLGDAELFDRAAQWLRSHPNHCLITVRLMEKTVDSEGDTTVLELYVSSD